jgi:hypothetical protein
LTRPSSDDVIRAIALRATEASTPEELLSVLEDLLSTCSEIVSAMIAERRSAVPNPSQLTGGEQ